MGNVLYLATEAVEESGFGLNFDLLETNIINLAIVFVLLIVYGGKIVGNILTARRSKIETEIKEAETIAANSAAALSEAQENLTQAQARAAQIKADAETTASKVKAEILAQGKQEVEKIKAAAVKELDTEKAKAIAELKQRIGTLAVERVESQLKERLDASAQQKLVDRCIAQLGGN